MNKRDKITFVLATILFFVIMVVGTTHLSKANATALLTISLLAYLVYDGYLMHKHFATKKGAKERRQSRYGATMSGTLKHISGLPIAGDILVELYYCPDKIVFIKAGQEIVVAKDKITSIDVITKSSKTKAMAGAAMGRRIYGKTVGGAIGAMASISTQLVISYTSDGKSKRITLDAYNSGSLVSRIEKDFRQSHHFKSSTTEL